MNKGVQTEIMFYSRNIDSDGNIYLTYLLLTLEKGKNED